jgi:hypothetical protein
MDIDDLSPAARAAVRALQRLGKRWPESLRLTIFEKTLYVTENSLGLVIPIDGIPAGEDAGLPGRLWDYQFLMDDGAQLGRQLCRKTVTEAQFGALRDGMAALGLDMKEITRKPHLPSERVS